MIEIIKETGIFIIVAEAMVYLSPSEIYAKYIRLIVGMVLIVRLALPVLSLVTGGESQFYMNQFPVYEEGKRETAAWQEKSGEEQESYLQQHMEKEIRQRLEAGEDAAQILDVKFREREDGSLYLLITLGTEEGESSLLQQRQHFADKLQMEISDVEVEVSAWG